MARIHSRYSELMARILIPCTYFESRFRSGATVTLFLTLKYFLFKLFLCNVVTVAIERNR